LRHIEVFHNKMQLTNIIVKPFINVFACVLKHILR